MNNTLCLDTGCVFGGQLTSLRYPERTIVSVAAERVWYAPVKPFPSVAPSDPSEHSAHSTPAQNPAASQVAGSLPLQRADPDQLDILDVIGKRVIETAHHRRVTVHEENAAGALEVMSRFALHPRRVPYLPPTMAPAPTATREGLLEHPDEAFSAYHAQGVTDLICEEKHMGSRAVVLVCRDVDAAAATWGCAAGDIGAVYTRTGRSFFDPITTAAFLGRTRQALTRAGLWQEWDTDWILLDTEIVPWSVKAEDLLRDQYAAVGACATHALAVAEAGLDAAQSRGLEVGELSQRTRSRSHNASAFRTAYRRYCWGTDGLDGVECAPFQVLASGGTTYHHRDHGWHLAIADRLVAAAPGFVRTTRRIRVDTRDEGSRQQAAAWWQRLTDEGGEGMVVKPHANLARRGRKGLVQPGIKVRGREYLRIIYGPDYTEPGHLDRLRQRQLGHKRALALREYALGLESLQRLAAAEPL